MAIDAKSVVTFERQPLVAEMKFLISVLPPEGTYQNNVDALLAHGHLVKKGMFKFLKDGLVIK